ncbi:hypothetical protein A3F62_04015 [Candidatus Woesebacteria bacterium RIFCSPHIGHO2_12_FULL_44_11]|nr:MAG: hypothetical protein A3F62_04015 [Candidatus Woesebacteria bacterium RIFCSPHIGHO2_12_FULL_44_11]
MTKVYQFNACPSTVMHVDLNSAFATIEQQVNPNLRGKPIVVAAYNSPGGCILAASREAKIFGIKTGMRVKEGQRLCSVLQILTPQPNLYRRVHLELRELLKNFSDQVFPKSIDEFVLDFKNFQALPDLFATARGIKKRIREEVGEWLTVSIGIAPNRFLAKTASNSKKPDGLVEINSSNFLAAYGQLTLPDLHGIAFKNTLRLNSVGIYSVLDMYQAPLSLLRAAFSSINSYYWYLRLRGWEIDNIEFGRRSFGNSYALPRRIAEKSGLLGLFPILQKLCEKTGQRLRRAGYLAGGIWVSLRFRDGSFWQQSRKLPREVFDSRDIFKVALLTLRECKQIKPVHTIAISCFNLVGSKNLQLELFSNREKQVRLMSAIDQTNRRWGDFTVGPAGLLNLKSEIHDRISFGNVSLLAKTSGNL